MNKKARIIAYYLPQFHPIPENDKWWGKGFTEWTNVAKATPLYKGHYQPKIPADLGFYDLRLPQVRKAQAELAHEAGIEGFCYWHYWFGKNKKLLDTPFNEVLNSGEPNFPFCLGWANHSWSNKTWEKGNSKTTDSILMEQTYSEEDYEIHFYELLKAFKDERYITVDGKPVFVVFDPLAIPAPNKFITIWQELAKENGLKGIHFVGIISNLSGFKINEKGEKKYYIASPSEPATERYKQVLNAGFDAINSRGLFRAEMKAKGRLRKLAYKFLRKYSPIKLLDKYSYEKIIKNLYVEEDKWENVYPTILPNWDRSARSGKNASIYHGSTPELFRNNIERALEYTKEKNDEHKILFLMSWNEWAEGNYIEPDLKFGKQYLNVIKETILHK